MAILSSSDYDAIRAAIDVTLTSDMLPDSVIALDIYSGAGEQDVLDLDSTAESATGSDATHVKNAAVYFTAARLAPAVPAIVSQQREDQQYRRQEVDWDARVDELRRLAFEEMDYVLGDTEEDEARHMPTMFTAGSGGRGKVK